MAFSAQTGAQGAQTGAAIGSIAGPIGTGAGAVIGFIAGGIIGGNRLRRQQRREEARRRRLDRRLQYLSSPEHFFEEMNKLRAGYREQVAAGPGQQAQQGVRSLVARRGLTGTGIGDTMLAAAEQAPEIEALRQSFQGAQDLVGQQLANERFYGAQGPFPQGLLPQGLDAQTANSISAAGGIYSLLRDQKPTPFNRGQAPYQTSTKPFQDSLFPSQQFGASTSQSVPPIDYDSLFQYSAGF